MSQPRHPLSILLAFVILGGLIVAIYFFLHWLFSALGAEKDSSLAIVVATLFAVIIMVAGIRQAGRSKEIDPLRFEKKAAAYQQLINAWTRGASAHSSSVDEHQTSTVQAAMQEVTLWGSSEVIRHLRPFSEKSQPIDIQDSQQRSAIENVLRAMRRDLGQRNLVLQHGDLLNLFIHRDS